LLPRVAPGSKLDHEISPQCNSAGSDLSLCALTESTPLDEPGSTDLLGHYDSRFYRGAAVSYEDRIDTQQHMIRAYFSTFRNLHIETWIAYGTLLGWWWNGQILP
jgi:hypothetical protein